MENFVCLGSAVTTPILTTNAPSSQLPFVVSQTNCSSSTETNKNVDATIGSSSTYGIFTAVIDSVTLIAVVGMWIYNRQIFKRLVANAAIPNPVQRRNCEENNLYMEASL
ncbi:hypothetical protein JTE90_005131 [Oedothorax gibbosus]|uniref:Uncharacterized protein n=1 Tax=Oedothorax gibbosus TaxID=931172 RepID=A0AAV6UL55_9ARAC|nr:hypothetical protein JTE90_005131 [Oedothorax gibbosus]